MRAGLANAWEAAAKESGLLDALGGAVGGVDDLRDRVVAPRARLRRMLTELGWIRSLAFALGAVGAPLAVAYFVRSRLGWQAVGSSLSSIVTLISVAGLWARKATKAVGRVDAAIAKVTAKYEETIAQSEPLQTAMKELERAKADDATASRQIEDARAAVCQAEAEAARAALPAQVLTLVSDRLRSPDYKSELTTVSLARADLEALTRILHDQRVNPAGSGVLSQARAVERVILYIDDLDRCRPEDVVRVLQLVHMLLAFKLFAVVVAVDARWVEDALRQSFRSFAAVGGEQGQLSPQDYLEKIFQIAFWLEPMTPARAAAYIASLVRTPGRRSTAPLLAISPSELDYMRALAGYVGTSPRRVKRLVNSYRMIKARLSDAQLKAFVTDRGDGNAPRSGPYQIVIGLLVILTASPALGPEIVRQLSDWDPRDSVDHVIEVFRREGHPDRAMASQVLETLMRTQDARNVAEFRGWAQRVERYFIHRSGRYGHASRGATSALAHTGPAEEILANETPVSPEGPRPGERRSPREPRSRSKLE
jgi:hypothetical protein